MRAVLTGRYGRGLIALGLGGVAALGQAPWGAWPVTVVALAALMALVARSTSARAGFWAGWLAGTAHFALCLAWIVEPFLIEPERHGWMAPFALVFMAGGLALFWAVAAGLATASVRAPVARVWAFAGAFVAFEAVRGYIFTGFPWALSGHIWIGTPMDQSAALGGALMLSAWALGLAAALATAALRAAAGRILRAGVVAGAGVLALASAWGWGAARLAQPVPLGTGVPIRLVQANVPQHLKWQPDLVMEFFNRHLDLSAAPGETVPQLVIWPESAAPFLLNDAGSGLRMIAEAAQAPVVFGVDRRARTEDGLVQYFNSLAMIDTEGQIMAQYDKHHLVPFGEYVPLVAYLPGDWRGLAARVLSGYAPGPGPRVIDLGAAGRVVPLICYEAVFARSLHTEERPDWILQITNDAWFGTRSGPFQHLAQAQLRAVETGLPLVRVANTGVTAVIDPMGRIVASLGLGERGFLDSTVPGALVPTLYAQVGDGPWTIGLSILVLWLGARVWRRRVRHRV